MIPLRIKAYADDTREPFVVRLNVAHRDGLTEGDAVLNQLSTSGELEFSSSYGCFRLEGIDASDVDQDVIMVSPRQRIAHRFIRANSKHNTFLVTERCDQMCVMCSQPPKKGHVDYFQYFLEAALLAPANAIIGLSGGEPTLFKEQLFILLDTISQRRPDIGFHVLSNAQHIFETDIGPLSEINNPNILWGVPLYSNRPEIHDEIVGKQGAFHRLREALSALNRASANIELRTIVIQRNFFHFGEIAKFVGLQMPFVSKWAIMQLENIGFARMNWSKLFVDNSVSFGQLAEALDIASAMGLHTELYNFPLCTIPERYRPFAVSSISDWKQKYLKACSSCNEKPSCGGFFEWYPETQGYTGIRQL